jgi:hypothetical protein
MTPRVFVIQRKRPNRRIRMRVLSETTRLSASLMGARAATQRQCSVAAMSAAGGTPRRECVVQYLYVHNPGERFEYPSSRSSGGSANTAMRYLECALVQSASLRMHDADADILLVTNLENPRDPALVEQRGVRLLDKMQSLGVRLVHAAYEHRSPKPVPMFEASRYVLDAIGAVADEGTTSERRFWFVDVDCVWLDPPRVFAAAPPAGSVGCIHIDYPPDWDINGVTPRGVGELGRELGDCPVPVEWVGGELLCGGAADLTGMVTACEQLDQEVSAHGAELPAEEQLLSLAGGLGRVRFTDLSSVAWRLWTGPRHGALPHSDPASLGLWHLPSEKGLGLRRAANEILSGRTKRLRRDLQDPARAMRRFNVGGTGWMRRLRDDGWLATYRLRRAIESRAR